MHRLPACILVAMSLTSCANRPAPPPEPPAAHRSLGALPAHRVPLTGGRGWVLAIPPRDPMAAENVFWTARFSFDATTDSERMEAYWQLDRLSSIERVRLMRLANRVAGTNPVSRRWSALASATVRRAAPPHQWTGLERFDDSEDCRDEIRRMRERSRARRSRLHGHYYNHGVDWKAIDSLVNEIRIDNAQCIPVAAR